MKLSRISALLLILVGIFGFGCQGLNQGLNLPQDKITHFVKGKGRVELSRKGCFLGGGVFTNTAGRDLSNFRIQFLGLDDNRNTLSSVWLYFPPTVAGGSSNMLGEYNKEGIVPFDPVSGKFSLGFGCNLITQYKFLDAI